MSRQEQSVGDHPAADDIARFVIDALAPTARQRFEEHVAACAPCARALAAEAAAEEALAALWPSVRRPLAEVVPLSTRRPAPAAAPAAPAPVPIIPATRGAAGARGSHSSQGGLAALVAVLFLGWWTDAGRNFAGVSAGASSRLAPLAACLLPGGPLASGEIDEDPVCAAVALPVPSLAALASWGMCAGSGASGPNRCHSPAVPICAGPTP